MRRTNELKGSWVLSPEAWKAMDHHARRWHCYAVNAFFRAEDLRRQGSPVNDLQVWLDAEQEMYDRIQQRPSILWD